MANKKEGCIDIVIYNVPVDNAEKIKNYVENKVGTNVSAFFKQQIRTVISTAPPESLLKKPE